jgi:hypothetical protein
MDDQHKELVDAMLDLMACCYAPSLTKNEHGQTDPRALMWARADAALANVTGRGYTELMAEKGGLALGPR